MTTLSSREFNHKTSEAKRAADRGPVFITNRGRPSYVLLSIETYRKLSGAEQNISDLLAASAREEIDFEPPRLGDLPRSAELT
jgi:prevent-host-death family protein